MQHLAGNTEGPKLPQEVQSALSLLVDGFTVASLLQAVVQVNTEALNSSTNSTSSPMMEIVFDLFLFSLKIYNHLCFIHIQDEMFPHHATKRSTTFLYSASCSSLIHPTTAEPSEYFCR
ncbi:hypothetical protein CHARACLAT_015871 [Characodon lateralis]|uniref:Uncharacterized protein n=1 Tax=Characodon lateralis TaxID=208331 RepID=A0ABU7DA75_9TELE|nr:hypothetical protein [Characodon lateralis]